METETAQTTTKATKTNNPNRKPTDDRKCTDKVGKNTGSKATNDTNARGSPSEAVTYITSDWGASSEWDVPNTMDTRNEEPPLKTSKTKDQITGETRKTNTKKRRKVRRAPTNK